MPRYWGRPHCRSAPSSARVKRAGWSAPGIPITRGSSRSPGVSEHRNRAEVRARRAFSAQKRQSSREERSRNSGAPEQGLGACPANPHRFDRGPIQRSLEVRSPGFAMSTPSMASAGAETAERSGRAHRFPPRQVGPTYDPVAGRPACWVVAIGFINTEVRQPGPSAVRPSRVIVDSRAYLPTRSSQLPRSPAQVEPGPKSPNSRRTCS